MPPTDDAIPETPPEGEEDRAIWMIRKLARSTLGKTLSEHEARKLFSVTKEKMAEAMDEAKNHG
jgi:hypothetical protein